MLEWRIFYGDGTTFSSDDGEPSDAPALNVQAIAQPDPDCGRHVLHRNDYYWHDGEWYGGDLFGLFDYLSRSGVKAVKFGRTVPNEVYLRTLKAAIDDPDFPLKSADRR